MPHHYKGLDRTRRRRERKLRQAKRPKRQCDYCGQRGVQVDCNGQTCCAECWQGMKDWTVKKSAELDRLSRDVTAWLDEERPKILAENGLPPDARGIICTRCRKMVQWDEDGLMWCDCHDERKGISPDEPGIVPLPARFFRDMGE